MLTSPKDINWKKTGEETIIWQRHKVVVMIQRNPDADNFL